MNDIPEGFNGVYRCRNHPERPVVAPIACRWCAECAEDARARYAAQGPAPTVLGKYDEKAPDGRSIVREYERNPRKAKEWI